MHKEFALGFIVLGVLSTTGAHADPLPAQTAPTASVPKAGAGIEPPPFTLLTTHSTSGNFLVSPGGCSEGAGSVELTPAGGGAAIATTSTQVGCLTLFAPTAALAPGEYCVTNHLAAFGPAGACFSVTGEVPDLAQASVSAALSADPALEASCALCPDGTSQSCTRLEYWFYVHATLEGVGPEIATSHRFALSYAQGEDESLETPLPAEPVWTTLSPGLATYVDIDEFTGNVVCVGLYAQPIAGGESTFVGRSCLARPAQNTFPSDSFNVPAGCELDHQERWCADNLADCTQEPEHTFAPGALGVCEYYEFDCNPDGSARPRPELEEPEDSLPDPQQSLATPDTSDSLGSDEATREEDDHSAPQASNGSGGCSAAAGHAGGGMWMLFVALLAAAAGRMHRRTSVS